jgi:hypothetical protein
MKITFFAVLGLIDVAFAALLLQLLSSLRETPSRSSQSVRVDGETSAVPMLRALRSDAEHLLLLFKENRSKYSMAP